MAESQLWNNLGYVEKCLMAARASMNGIALSSEGSKVKLLNCGIDTMKISTFGEYMANREGKLDLMDDEKLAKKFVIPVTLPNGQQIEVIVNKDGQDEACIYRDEAGTEREFQLTPRMKEVIKSSAPENLKDFISPKEIEKSLCPNNLDDYAEKVQKDELVPKSEKQALEIIHQKNKSFDLESEKEDNEKVEDNKEVPEEARDIIAKICSENDLDVGELQQVIEVPPKIISDNLERTGIKENGGRVYCLRFKNGENLQGRVVMAQGENIVDNRTYDDYMTDFMNEHRGQKIIRSAEDEHDKISYTDLDGNTTVCEIMREPRDMNCSQKELLIAEMQKLDQNARTILNSDMPLENKTEEMIKINQKRLNMFKECGISVPTVESEIRADDQISNAVQNKAIEQRNAEEQESAKKQEEEKVQQQEEEEYDDYGRPKIPGKREH